MWRTVAVIVGVVVVAAVLLWGISRRQGEREIFLAAARGDVDTIRALLDRGVSPNARDEHGKTPLIWAAMNGSLPVVQLLLERGADVNAADKYGVTALMMAANPRQRAQSEVLVALLDKGANINAADSNGRTPLMYALSDNEKEIAILLIERGGCKRHQQLRRDAADPGGNVRRAKGG